jgi:hypothetical protein
VKIWRKEVAGIFFCNFLKYFEIQGSSRNFCGLRLDFTEGRGANYKIDGYFLAQNFFSMGNTVDSVHHPWTMGGTGPRWTTDRASAVAQRKEGCTGNSMGRSREIRWQRGDRAMAVKKCWRRRSVQAALGCREKRRVAGRGAVENGRALPLYRG